MPDRLAEIQRLPKSAWPQYLSALSDEDKDEIISSLKAGQMAARYQNDPVAFIEEQLDESVWSKQQAIARAIVEHERVAIPACHAPGKAAVLDTRLPTPTGWTTMGEVQPGDWLYDENGKPCQVVAVTPVHERPCYRVTFDDGAAVEVAGEHEWNVLDAHARHACRQRKNSSPADWRDHWVLARTVETSAMLAEGLTTKSLGRRFAVPVARPLAGVATRPFLIPPYTFGAWLGDGHSDAAAITGSRSDAEVISSIRAEGIEVRERPSHSNERNAEWGLLGLKVALREAGVLGNKHIPEVVLRSDVATRLAVMQGLVDTDGYLADGESYEITLCNRRLANDVLDLARSLGWKARWSEGRAMLRGRDCGPKFRIRFWPDMPAARLSRKLPSGGSAQRSRSTARFVVAVEPIGVRPVKCVEVDGPSHLFLMGDAMVPTHNSHLAARIVAWWIQSHPVGTALAVTTSTTFRQVRNILWPHIRRIHDRHDLPGRTNMVEWIIGDEIVAYGFSAADQDPEAVQGIHAPHLLILVDEAAGISHSLGSAFESLLSGGHVRIVLLGNPPVDNEGTWFEQCCENPKWHTIPIPAESTPNWTGEETGICKACPGSVPEHPVSDHLISRKWAQELEEDYGPDSPMVLAKVHARFPKGVATKAIPYSWVEAAVDNEHPFVGTKIRLGVDVASDGGDEVVVARVVGHTADIIYANAGKANANAVDVAGEILREIDAAEELNEQLGNLDPVVVKIDGIGVGWGVASTLQRWGEDGRHNAIVIPVKVSEKPAEPDKFINQRAEMWWNARVNYFAPQRDAEGNPLGWKFKLKGMDRKTVAQFSAPNYRTDVSGKIRLERKVEMKARGVGSPDRAEAVLLALYDPPPSETKRKARLIL